MIAAALVSGMGPQAEPEVWRRLSTLYRVNFGLIRRVPVFARVAAALMRRSVNSEKGFLLRRLAVRLPAEDQRIMEHSRMEAELNEAIVESLRLGSSGTIQDLPVFARPWGFRFEEVSVPVLLWHGTEDAHTPIVMGRFVAERIPGCQATFLEGAGHLWLFENFDTVFDALTKQAVV